MTNVSVFGIEPTNPDNTALFQAALDYGHRVFHFEENAIYDFMDTVTIPQGAYVKFSGVGYDMTTLRLLSSTGRSLFNYWRPIGQPRGGPTAAKGSNAINYCGADPVVSDSWLRITDCMFYSFEADVRVANASMNHFTGNFHAFGDYAYILGRGASFTHFNRVFSFNKNFIYARDDADDALSNGMFLDQCNAITGQGCNMFVRGWQAVFIDKCGFDLGSADQAALWFRNCQDVYLSKSFVSSNGNGIRDGILLDQTHTFGITDNTIVNNRVGIQVIPPAQFSPSNGTIKGNTFDGNSINDVLLMPGARGVKISENHFKKQMSRTGTNFEVYGNLPGVNKCHIIDNTFAGSVYPIVVGTNSVVRDNLFEVV
jgi:hypothetical protein